jgi:hypothetical protein
MQTYLTIYFVIGALWALGIHAYAAITDGYFSDKSALHWKIARGLVGVAFQTAFWVYLAPKNIIKLIKKEKGISLTFLQINTKK